MATSMLRCLIVTMFVMINLYAEEDNEIVFDENLIVSTTQIFIEDFPLAYNPSILQTEHGLLLSFRVNPNLNDPWISWIGLVFLDENFEPISKPQIVNTRAWSSKIPSQAEDARLFSFQGNMYLIYNDNINMVNPPSQKRRDMFFAQLHYEDEKFTLSEPVKILHKQKYHRHNWQKNWAPFEWNNTLFFTYSISPHEIVQPIFSSGECHPIYKTEGSVNWTDGILRGGTPALEMDDHYLAFFHSGIVKKSSVSNGMLMWHYYMGAYTFSNQPPFEILMMSPAPIMADNFYTYSSFHKRVVFPGGFVVDGDRVHVAYGKDDSEVWVVTINKKKLYESMVPVR